MQFSEGNSYGPRTLRGQCGRAHHCWLSGRDWTVDPPRLVEVSLMGSGFAEGKLVLHGILHGKLAAGPIHETILSPAWCKCGQLKFRILSAEYFYVNEIGLSFLCSLFGG